MQNLRLLFISVLRNEELKGKEKRTIRSSIKIRHSYNGDQMILWIRGEKRENPRGELYRPI